MSQECGEVEGELICETMTLLMKLINPTAYCHNIYLIKPLYHDAPGQFDLNNQTTLLSHIFCSGVTLNCSQFLEFELEVFLLHLSC